MKVNHPEEYNKERKTLISKWQNKETYSQIEGYRNNEEFSTSAKKLRNDYLPHALSLNILYCPNCGKKFDDVDDFQHILEYCDDCCCDLEIDDLELTLTTQNLKL